MKLFFLALTTLLMACSSESKKLVAISIDEETLISHQKNEVKRIEAFYKNMISLERVIQSLKRKVNISNQVVFERRYSNDKGLLNGILILGTFKHDTSHLLIIITDSLGTPRSYLEFNKKAVRSAIYEINSDNQTLNISWFKTSTGNAVLHSKDTFILQGNNIRIR